MSNVFNRGGIINERKINIKGCRKQLLDTYEINKGITLVALTITIIVLLILAGVSYTDKLLNYFLKVVFFIESDGKY